MILRLNLSGIVVTMKIWNYVPSRGFEWDGWCKTDISWVSEPWLNLSYHEDEIFMPNEIEETVKMLKAFLNNEFTEVETWRFIEPDFEFILHPQRKEPRFMTRPTFELMDVSMEWKVSFWHRESGLTGNYLLLDLEKQDIEKLLLYFQIVIGEVNTADERVQEMVPAWSAASRWRTSRLGVWSSPWGECVVPVPAL